MLRIVAKALKKTDGETLAEVDRFLFPRLLYERYHHFGLFALQAQ